MARHNNLIERNATDAPKRIRGATERGTRELQAIVKKYMKQVASKQFDFMQEVFDILGLGKFGTELKGFEPKIKLPELITVHKCDDGCIHHHWKAFDPSINFEFERIFGREIADKLNKAAKKLINGLMDTPDVDPGKSKAIFQDLYFDTVVTAGNDAYRAAFDEWNKQSKAFKEQNPWNGNPTTFFDKNTKWVQDMYKNGYDLVTSAVTEKYLPAIKEIMNEAWKDDKVLNINQIASEMQFRFQDGGIAHWKRLVRTETGKAAYNETMQRYKELEAGYIRWGVSPSACPICVNFREYNGGYYEIDRAPRKPQDTHPNCACVQVPVWNLRKGIDPNGNREDAIAQYDG